MDDARADRLESKIDKIGDRISSIDTTLAAQHEQLAYHIKRTTLLEEAFKPVQKQVQQVSAALRLLSYIGGAIGLVAGIAEIMSFLRGVK